MLDASRPSSEFEDAPLVVFTTEDLPRLGPDDVLAATGTDDTEVISRESFVERTRCD